MKIILAHNFYQNRGGEDEVFSSEQRLLEKHGQSVLNFIESNSHILKTSTLQIFARTIWSIPAKKKLRQFNGAQVVHIHNAFPLFSPSVYYGAHQARAAVVQTLHNYRLLCPNALFLRDNKPCEVCKGMFFAWPGVLYRCYRHSLGATLVTALMLSFHKLIGTWNNQVDVYIALTEFSKMKFIEGGLPASRIVVKPNFVDPDPGVKSQRGEFAIFVGRLSAEKGVRTLISAWSELPDIPLAIAGDGPMVGEVKGGKATSVTLLGKKNHDEVIQMMKRSRFLVLPSECYENFPLTVTEAYACGLPIIASNLGVMAELVQDGKTGLLFNPGDPVDLANKVRFLWNSPEKLEEMSKNARAEYEAKYTAEKNYEKLMNIYQIAIKRNQARGNDKRHAGFFARFQSHRN